MQVSRGHHRNLQGAKGQSAAVLREHSLGSAVSVGETYIVCPFPLTAEKVLSGAAGTLSMA